jgi:hypothetical protein
MLTEAEAARKAFEEQQQMRQHVRDYAKARARRDVVRTHKAEFLSGDAQQRFERLLETCEKDADQIACEAGEEASAQASRTELGVVAYEVAYIEAYADVFQALVATTLARCDLLDGPGRDLKAERHENRRIRRG